MPRGEAIRTMSLVRGLEDFACLSRPQNCIVRHMSVQCAWPLVLVCVFAAESESGHGL